MDRRRLNTFQLCPTLLNKLKQNGYVVASDLQNLKGHELMKDLNISIESALEILDTVKGRKVASSEAKSAAELLSVEDEEVTCVTTFCESIDNLLDGGIALGRLTEISGQPGAGKTQLCMQLAVDVQVPPSLGGVGRSAIYIDCEGGLVPSRLSQIADAAVAHCQRASKRCCHLTSKDILEHVYVVRCLDYVQLIATCHQLDSIIADKKEVGLVIVDSIATHFRHDFTDMAMRSRLLNLCAQKLLAAANKYSLAAVVTNQVTTKVGGEGDGQLIPSLGPSWGHIPSVRLMLTRTGQVERQVKIIKSSCHAHNTATYQVLPDGIRDCVTCTEPPAKRPHLDIT